jgi:hypothetical protein
MEMGVERVVPHLFFNWVERQRDLLVLGQSLIQLLDVLVMISPCPVYQSLFKHLMSLIHSAVINVLTLVPDLSKEGVCMSKANIKDRLSFVV